jgi:hypothetical protein
MRVSPPVDAGTTRSDPGDDRPDEGAQLAATVLLLEDPEDPLDAELRDDESFVVEDDESFEDESVEADFSASAAVSVPLLAPDPLLEPLLDARESLR